MSLFGVEVGYRKYKTHKLDAALQENTGYAIPDSLVGVFSNREIRFFRRAFSYSDEDFSGTSNLAQFVLFEAKTELSFSDYLFTMQRARLEDRQSEVSEFTDAAKAKASARQGGTIFFSFLFFSFIILISTSSAVFEYFQCASFEEVLPAVSYLVRDYSLNCASSRYKSYVAYAVAMLFVYPLG